MHLAQTLPHAIIMQTSPESGNQLVQELIDTTSLTSADYLFFDCLESLKIADARIIRRFVSLTRSNGPIKIVFIADASKLTNEAANAILKTLEEPPAKTHIILATEQVDTLLPTIRSRCRLIRLTRLNHRKPEDLPVFPTLAEYIELAKELAGKDTDLSSYLQAWLTGQATTKQQELILDYLPHASTNVNRRMLLDNFFLELYNLNQY